MATHHHIPRDYGGRPRASASRYEQNVAIYPLDHDETEYSKRPLYEPRRRQVSLGAEEQFSRRVRDKFWFLRKYTRAPLIEPKSVAQQTREQLGEERRAGRDRIALMLAEHPLVRPSMLTTSYLQTRKGDLSGSIAVKPLSEASEFPALEVEPMIDLELLSIINSHKLQILRDAVNAEEAAATAEDDAAAVDDEKSAESSSNEGSEADDIELQRLENKQARFFLHATATFETSADDVRNYFRKLLAREMEVDELTLTLEVATLKPMEFLVSIKDELQYGHVARVERRRYNRIQNEAESILPSRHSKVDPLEVSESALRYGWDTLRDETEQLEEHRLKSIHWSAQDSKRFELQGAQVDYAAKLLQNIQGLGVQLDKPDTDLLLYGTVRTYHLDKGFGFLTIDQHSRVPREMPNRDILRAGKEVFFHRNDVLGEDGKAIDRRAKNKEEIVIMASDNSETPTKVMFRVKQDPKTDKWRGADITRNVSEADFKKALEDQGLTLDVGQQDNFGSEEEVGKSDLYSELYDDEFENEDVSLPSSKSASTSTESDPWKLASSSSTSATDVTSAFSSVPPQASPTPRQTYPAQVEMPLHTPEVHSPAAESTPAVDEYQQQQQPPQEQAPQYATTPQQPAAVQYGQQPPQYFAPQQPPQYGGYQQQPPTSQYYDSSGFMYQQQPQQQPVLDWNSPYHAQQGLVPMQGGPHFEQQPPSYQQVPYGSAAQAATSHNMQMSNLPPSWADFPQSIELMNFPQRPEVQGRWRLCNQMAHYNNVPYYEKEDGTMFMFYAPHPQREYAHTSLWYVSRSFGDTTNFLVCSAAGTQLLVPSEIEWKVYDGMDYVPVASYDAVRVLAGSAQGQYQAPPSPFGQHRFFSSGNGNGNGKSGSSTHLTGLRHSAPLLASRSSLSLVSGSRRLFHSSSAFSLSKGSSIRMRAQKESLRLVSRAALRR